MNEDLRRYYLKQMGIEVWERQDNSKTENMDTTSVIESVNVHSSMGWEELEARTKACQACILAKSRSHVVFGVGNRKADCLIIGEAPGFYEDKQAEPFVGRAGQLLNAMLTSIGKKRSDVYIANVLKCRPPENRDPLPEEVEKCTPFLIEQIQLVAPKVILALGRHAARFLLKKEESLAALRGKPHYWGEKHIPVLVSYHPAYLLRNPSDKSKAFLDWLNIKNWLEEKKQLE